MYFHFQAMYHIKHNLCISGKGFALLLLYVDFHYPTIALIYTRTIACNMYGLFTYHLIECNNTVFTRIIFALFDQFSRKNGVAKIMRGIFGRHCFRGDFQVRSRIGYLIHKLEIKHFTSII
jgi:hypothetical protein